MFLCRPIPYRKMISFSRIANLVVKRNNLCLKVLSKPIIESNKNVRFLTGCLFPFKNDINFITPNPSITQQTRLKYNKKGPETEEEDNEDDDTEYKDEQDSKVVKTTVNSLRADLIIKAGLGLARNKVEVVFYESRVRVNGQKITKKALNLNIDDEVDVIKSFSAMNPACLIISRVILLSAAPRSDGGFKVVLRRYKNMLIDNYKGANEYKSSQHEKHD